MRGADRAGGVVHAVVPDAVLGAIRHPPLQAHLGLAVGHADAEALLARLDNLLCRGLLHGNLRADSEPRRDSERRSPPHVAQDQTTLLSAQLTSRAE